MNKAAVAKIITTLIMLFFSIVMIVPFLWMISTSFKNPLQRYSAIRSSGFRTTLTGVIMLRSGPVQAASCLTI
ncbi:hypothetical protein ACFSQ7_50520 [Paenibacillus rhizoplanae]